MQREEAARNIAELAQLARQRLDSLDSEAISLAAVARTQASSRNGLFSEPPVLFSCKSVKAMRKLAQTWILMKRVHESLLAGEKQTQRELWYKLKPSGLFSSAEEVFERVLDVCAVITQHAGVPCPREALGVISTSKGAVTGAVSIAQDGGTLALDQSVHLLSGDPEICSALRFSESRARCILVVEKDTVFNRLFDDGFVRRLPCLVRACRWALEKTRHNLDPCCNAHKILVTAKGFPDLATRAFVRRAIDVLQVPCFAFTDHNPYGLAVMLTYKHSSATFAIERYKCPEMVWIGLGCADVARMLQQVGSQNNPRATQEQRTRYSSHAAEYQPAIVRYEKENASIIDSKTKVHDLRTHRRKTTASTSTKQRLRRWLVHFSAFPHATSRCFKGSRRARKSKRTRASSVKSRPCSTISGNSK
eukprot:6189463-Pleurochrysis_carterae.AAC.2